MKFVKCPACGGDGKETCDNPDHGFIDAVGGELGRLGCPCCGHDENHKIKEWHNGKWIYQDCDICGGAGHLNIVDANIWCNETGYDNELEEVHLDKLVIHVK